MAAVFEAGQGMPVGSVQGERLLESKRMNMLQAEIISQTDTAL